MKRSRIHQRDRKRWIFVPLSLEDRGANSLRHRGHQRSRIETVALDIAEEHGRIVRDILHAHLPESARVWIFGSRATGRARPYSDIDLAIDAGRSLMLDECAILKEAFSDSELPYRVDIVDWQAIDADFRRRVETERVRLNHAVHTQASGGA